MSRKPGNHNDPWTNEDLALLREQWVKSSISTKTIAQRLYRTVGSVKNKASVLGLPNRRWRTGSRRNGDSTLPAGRAGKDSAKANGNGNGNTANTQGTKANGFTVTVSHSGSQVLSRTVGDAQAGRVLIEILGS